MIKKRTLFLSMLLLILILGTTSFATTQSGYLMDNETMTKVIGRLGFANLNEEQINGMTYWYNEWARSYRETVEFTLKNVAFFKNSGNLCFTVSNATFNNELPYMYIHSYGNNTNYSTTVNEFISWKYDTNNKINGVNTNKLKYWQLTTSNYTEYTNTISLTRNKTDTIKSESIYIPEVVVFIPTYTVYGSTGEYGYKTYFLNNYIEIDTGTIIPTPTPTPTTTPTPGGGSTGGTDLTPVIGKLDETNKNLEEIKNNIPTSGDIEKATEEANKNYWGDSQKMNESDYENQIKNGINSSMGEISENLEKNKIFKSIAIAEQKIIDLFLEEPEDFKISWQNVKYLDKNLIPSGEINFSKMCRENETLGKVKSTLNIIVSAMISLQLFKYIYNLIMVTLGIDHPLILENDTDDITEISTTKVGNRTYVTKKTYKSDKKGGR